MTDGLAASPLHAVRQTLQDVAAAMPRRENVWGVRYAWFPLHDIWHEDVTAMTNGGHIQRLKWQPITRTPRWVHLGAIPAEEVVARRPAPPERPREEMYWIKPARIAESLLAIYGERGLVDSATLYAVELEVFERLRLDDLFFPESGDDLPATFRGVTERIGSQIEKLRRCEVSAPDGTPVALASELVPHVIVIGEEMRAGLQRTALWLRTHIDERHAEMERARNDQTGRYRGAYDRKDLAALAWMEVARRDEALNSMAMQHQQLPGIVGEIARLNAAALAQQGQQGLDVTALGEAIGKSLAANLNLAFGQQMPAIQSEEPAAKPEEPLAAKSSSKRARE